LAAEKLAVVSRNTAAYPVVELKNHYCVVPGGLMAIEVRVPTILREYTGGEKSVNAEGDTLQAVISNLEVNYPGIGGRLLDDSGLRRFVNVYLNDEDVRFLDGLNTSVGDKDAITILPAVAGG